VFWRELILQYPNDDPNAIMRYKENPRWLLIMEKEQGLLLRLFHMCRFDHELYTRILSRCEELTKPVSSSEPGTH